MSGPDFDGARRYALARLAQELAPELVYHSVSHTRDDVLPAAARLAALEAVGAEDRELLLTAAAFHDLGFVADSVEHEEAGIQIARTMLPQFGFTATQIAVVCAIIQATILPQRPQTLLEAIMADADLDVLGRDDFLLRNERLRAEMAARGQVVTDVIWYRQQLSFLGSHSYFTNAARTLRSKAKQRNMDVLATRLRLLDNGAYTETETR